MKSVKSIINETTKRNSKITPLAEKYISQAVGGAGGTFQQFTKTTGDSSGGPFWQQTIRHELKSS